MFTRTEASYIRTRIAATSLRTIVLVGWKVPAASEQIACRMRHLVYGFTTVQKHEDLTSAANVLGITITAHPGLVEITLPGLLPACRVAALFYAGGYLAQFIYSAAYRMSMFSGMTRAAMM